MARPYDQRRTDTIFCDQIYRERRGTGSVIIGLMGEPGGVIAPRRTRRALMRNQGFPVHDETPRRASDTRLHIVGEALRSSWQTPTDTMITDDIPTLLTRLSQVPKTRKKR